MNAGITLCFYLVVGAGIAVPLWVGDKNATQFGRLFRAFTGLLFWPMYIPVLLDSGSSNSQFDEGLQGASDPQRPPLDEMAAAIAQVESELETVLHSITDWAEPSLSTDADLFADLRSAWRQQAERVRELDGILSATTADAAIQISSELEADSSPAGRILTIERNRAENLTKMYHIRQKWHDDLMATLAWVRQLVTMIHLARYTGAPSSRAVELVQQIANAVAGVPKKT